MPGLFGYLAAGAAEGVGTSLKEQGLAKREAALRKMEMDRETAFRRGEREASQAYQSSENALTRDATAEQSRLTREASGDLVTADDGTSYSRSGPTLTPLKDSSGAPIKAIGDKSESPADVKAAEWLIRQGVATDAGDAWAKVRSAKDNPNTRAKLVIDTYKTMKEDTQNYGVPDDELRRRAKSMVDQLIDEEDGGGAEPSTVKTPKFTVDNPAKPESKAEFDALPSGAIFLDPTGKVRVKP